METDLSEIEDQAIVDRASIQSRDESLNKIVLQVDKLQNILPQFENPSSQMHKSMVLAISGSGNFQENKDGNKYVDQVS